MQYFENIPTINYLPIGSEKSAILKNLFFKYVLNIEGTNLFQYYRINEVKRLDQISYELYKTTEHWWIIALMNDIQDIIFDLPLENAILHKIAKDIVTEQEEENEGSSYFDLDGSLSTEGMSLYVSEFEKLETENDKKRVLKVVRPNEIHRIVSLISENL